MGPVIETINKKEEPIAEGAEAKPVEKSTPAEKVKTKAEEKFDRKRAAAEAERESDKKAIYEPKNLSKEWENVKASREREAYER